MMRVFWRSREGKSPPPEAVFHWRGFPKSLVPAIKNTTRIETLPAPTKPIRVVKKQFFPEKKQWSQAVQKIAGAIRSSKLDKVVLARCCVLECENSPDPFAITAALVPRAQSATVFCFAKEGEMAFLGATPERLFTRQNDHFETEAVAGTTSRGRTEQEEAFWEQQLKKSEKIRREFSPVQNFLQKAFSPLSKTPLLISPLQVRKTETVQHLYTSLSGTLKPSISDAAILDKIHPTPALCGAPTALALQWIQNLEPFDRGLYGGAIGWSTPTRSEWVVAIRCCLIRGRIVHLYAGTGIVDGSDPDEEWEELDWKMGLYNGIFA